jgi:hypothetical protein
MLTFFILSGCQTITASSANFQYGLNAYNKGDYATALKQWTPLAEQGFANAQHNLGVMSLRFDTNQITHMLLLCSLLKGDLTL